MKKEVNASAWGAGLLRVGEAQLVQVHATVSDTPGSVRVVGHPKELHAKEMSIRLTSALGMEGHSAVVDLAGFVDEPRGSLDLAAAVAVLRGMETLAGASEKDIPLWDREAVFYAEIGLDGAVRPVRGGACVMDLSRRVYVSHKQNDVRYHPSPAKFWLDGLADLRDKPVLGEHKPFAALDKTLLVGRPGTGKTTRARRTDLLPPEKALEVLRVYSSAGLDYDGQKPFRAPHHTASARAMLGQGTRPGEVALALHGTLFLDELPEFAEATLNATAEALKAYRPANVVAASHPCPCGYAGNSGLPVCHCTTEQKSAYRERMYRLAKIVGITTEYRM